MKQWLVGAVALVGVISANGLASIQVKADEWGCTVVLCLSNPAGPTSVPECVPPVEELLAVIRSGGVPQCESGSDAVNLQISRGSKAKNRWFEFSDSTGKRTRTFY